MYMALELFAHVAGAMTLGAAVATTGGFGRTFGGMIGKPNEEIVVEPEEEPVPRAVPVPVPQPVQEPLPARFRHVQLPSGFQRRAARANACLGKKAASSEHLTTVFAGPPSDG